MTTWAARLLGAGFGGNRAEEEQPSLPKVEGVIDLTAYNFGSGGAQHEGCR